MDKPRTRSELSALTLEESHALLNQILGIMLDAFERKEGEPVVSLVMITMEKAVFKNTVPVRAKTLSSSKKARK